MRYRALLLLLVAVVLGSLAAYLVNNIVQQQVSQPVTEAQAAGVPTVIAVTDLPVGLALEQIHLRVIELPEEAIPVGAFQTIPEVLQGPAPIVLVSMRAGEVVLPDKLSTGIARRGLTTRIPDGARAVSIPVNEVRGVGGFVLPGDRVDVLHTTSIGRRDDRPVTRTLIQDMMVLGVDQVSSEATEEPVVVNVVTLLAEPEQAKTLTLAQRVGDLTLLLRNEGDRSEDESPTIALDDLWEYGPEDFAPRAAAQRSGRGGAAAGQLPPNQREVQVIRGLEVRDQAVDADSLSASSNR
ncbi:MAG: Flp pilus assembly protein CpaB [Gammaproteobacteria bacterium]|nr:Flp pilus assembly protein CpaB [Pseudomonadales bacterium]MCP5348224.1 Flp pilus assembly protein CpaB [Pseudomonadales bacterium]